MNETKQDMPQGTINKGVTFFDQFGRAIAADGDHTAAADISVEPGADTVCFSNIPHINMPDTKKRFPGVKKLVVPQKVVSIDIPNSLFPNVEEVVSYSPAFASGNMLVKTAVRFPNTLLNTFEKKPGEPVDLAGIGCIRTSAYAGCNAFDGCQSANILNAEGVCSAGAGAFDGYHGFDGCGKPYVWLGHVLAWIAPETKVLEIQSDNGRARIACSANGLERIIIHDHKDVAAIPEDFGGVLEMSNEGTAVPFLEEGQSCRAFRRYRLEVSTACYKTVNGIICSKDGKHMYFCTKGVRGSVAVPEGVTGIERNAFQDAKVTFVSLPSTLDRITQTVFKDCKELTRADILGEHVYVGHKIFYGCDKLTEIHAKNMFRRTMERAPISVEKVYIDASDMSGDSWKSFCALLHPELLDVKYILEQGCSFVTEVHAWGAVFCLPKFSDQLKGNGAVPILQSICHAARRDTKTAQSTIAMACRELWREIGDTDIKRFTALGLYQVYRDERTRKYLRRYANEMLCQLMLYNNEKEVCRMLSLGLVPEKTAAGFLEMAQEKKMDTAVAYILDMTKKKEGKRMKTFAL